AEQDRPGGEADRRDHRKHQADGLGEPRRRRVLEVGRRAQPWTDQMPEDQPGWSLLYAEAGSDREEHSLDAGENRRSGRRRIREQQRDRKDDEGDRGREAGTAW